MKGVARKVIGRRVPFTAPGVSAMGKLEAILECEHGVAIDPDEEPVSVRRCTECEATANVRCPWCSEAWSVVYHPEGRHTRCRVPLCRAVPRPGHITCEIHKAEEVRLPYRDEAKGDE